MIALSKKLCSRPIEAILAYATPENFLGRVVNGYTPGLTDLALMTKDSAQALCQVQSSLLEKHNLGLRIYDTYRPKRAVRDFAAWSTAPVTNDAQGHYELERKKIHYPHIEKNQMFNLGYISAESNHCYGHTVDLVLLDAQGQELDLGACFDFMDKLSHSSVTAAEIGTAAHHHRTILLEAMSAHGFISHPKEFWHFHYKEKTILEPMDIVISAELKGLNAPK